MRRSLVFPLLFLLFFIWEPTLAFTLSSPQPLSANLPGSGKFPSLPGYHLLVPIFRNWHSVGTLFFLPLLILCIEPVPFLFYVFFLSEDELLIIFPILSASLFTRGLSNLDARSLSSLLFPSNFFIDWSTYGSFQLNWLRPFGLVGFFFFGGGGLGVVVLRCCWVFF